MNYQKTIKYTINCSGVGLHTGKIVSLSIHPAPADYGIEFIRTDIHNNKNSVHARYDNVFKTQLGTTITNTHSIEVATVEHFMAALWGCDIDNAIIKINGPEVPIMDGSSEQFVFMIECAGVEILNTPRKSIEILKEIRVEEADSYAVFTPAQDFIVSAEISFNNNLISSQKYNFSNSNQSFKHELSKARTFGFIQDAEKLRQNGLAKGASLDNVLVINGEEILSSEGLRYADEFIRHKMLDLIGDFYLAGAPIKGELKIFKPGHTINNKILRTIFQDESSWRLAEL